ncbi:Uma2 family endonuclease [Thermoleptolyngbya sp. C42_A2020_037]|uniref:Uma2 family endonuclease n=1 Tax=Thermoleptolyngbya sp. C42_A2020_037 TaxID=2747799 RepID=UPI001A0846ED|nr:Uma2 family endonuclease [Thermoleptolyngbya sp. C42_A2020_037]MBF2083431.1 Uma2 family endonuclease [Thermoleptolyngbya sp. C42_A2020_037]
MQTKLLTNTWVSASWDEYLNLIQDPALEKAKGYYCDGRMRVEMTPIGNDHACDHTVVIVAVGLFSALRNITLTGRDNCTYRKTGYSEAQPDVSYYIGDAANAIPWGTTIIDLGQYPAPTLVIEIANTSLADDKGEKRLLYEALGVGEYWVVDVANVQILAFAIADGGSKRITESQVLPGLNLSLLEDTLRRTRETPQSEVIRWLLTQFQDM